MSHKRLHTLNAREPEVALNMRCGCGKRASYGHPGDRASRCIKCREMDMVNVRSPRCLCGKSQPKFAFPGEQASRCIKCREMDMVNVRSPRCVCGKYASFALAGERASRCVKCREMDMVNVRNSPCLCGKSRPSFALPGEQASRCGACKTDDMVDVISAKCHGVACLGERRVPRRGDLCSLCRIGSKYFKHWETTVAGWLSEWGVFPSSSDVCAVDCEGETNLKRPDFFFMTSDRPHKVILEVDEDYHRGIAVSCEMARMATIKNGLPGGGLIFVRFNPDEDRKDALEEHLRSALSSDGSVFQNSPYGVHVVYVGYPADRIACLVSDPDYKFTYENHSDYVRRTKKRKLGEQ